MRWRGKITAALALSCAVAVTVSSLAAAGGARTASPKDPARNGLRMFYSPPVLVRAGERVRIPVDVVCATRAGSACVATVTAGASVVADGWRTISGESSAGLRVDLSAAAGRASADAAPGGMGVVRFFLKARAGRSTVDLGRPTIAGALRFYVAQRMPVVDVPDVPVGDVTHGRTVLALPWGTGPTRAGLALGNQSATIGPSAFDVDVRGSVYLLDELQNRVAVFARGRLVRQISVRAAPPADLAVGSTGTLWVLSQQPRSSRLILRTIRAGRPAVTTSLGDGTPGEIRALGSRPYFHSLPQDEWTPADARNPAGASAMTGEPGPGGTQLLSAVTGRSVRLGTVEGDGVGDAIELRFSKLLGELALAEPDGRGGYLIVQHVWRLGRTPSDQYQVVHVSNGRILDTFAVANRSFAQSSILSVFRMGRDGALYQLRSSPAGMRIVRFDIGGGS